MLAETTIREALTEPGEPLAENIIAAVAKAVADSDTALDLMMDDDEAEKIARIALAAYARHTPSPLVCADLTMALR